MARFTLFPVMFSFFVRNDAWKKGGGEEIDKCRAFYHLKHLVVVMLSHSHSACCHASSITTIMWIIKSHQRRETEREDVV